MFSPSQAVKSFSLALLNKFLKVFHRPKFAQKKVFFSPRGSAGVATLKALSQGSRTALPCLRIAFWSTHKFNTHTHT